MTVIWTDEALDRLEEIVRFVFGRKNAQSYRWVRELFDHVDTLEQFPEVGREDFRELIWKGYRVMYTLKPDEVVVHTVRHGRRAWVDPDLGDGE